MFQLESVYFWVGNYPRQFIVGCRTGYGCGITGEDFNGLPNTFEVWLVFNELNLLVNETHSGILCNKILVSHFYFDKANICYCVRCWLCLYWFKMKVVS